MGDDLEGMDPAGVRGWKGGVQSTWHVSESFEGVGRAASHQSKFILCL
jgi:hypothetical protein